jgi:hypothetical protein
MRRLGFPKRFMTLTGICHCSGGFLTGWGSFAVKPSRDTAEEVRALTNFEMTGALRDREEREMAVFGS